MVALPRYDKLSVRELQVREYFKVLRDEKFNHYFQCNFMYLFSFFSFIFYEKKKNYRIEENMYIHES